MFKVVLESARKGPPFPCLSLRFDCSCRLPGHRRGAALHEEGEFGRKRGGAPDLQVSNRLRRPGR